MTIAPAAWNDTTVGAEFEVQLGKMLDAATNAGSPKPYLGNRAVQWGRINLTAAGVVPLTRRDMERFRLRKDDLLVCEGGEVGRAAIWEYDIECYYQKALHRLRTRRGYSPHILLALLELRARSDGFSDYVTQTSIAHLPRDKFIGLPIPAIPRAEQQEIASALLDADRLIAAIERAITKKCDIKQGMMQELLTGKTRLPGFNEPWKPELIADLLDFKNGLNKASQYFGHGTPIVNFMDVMRSPVITVDRVKGLVSLSRDEISRFSARRGDMFFTRTSETVEEVGTAATLVDDIPDAVFSGFILRGRPRSPLTNTVFLAHQFQLSSVRKQVVATASYTTRALTNGGSLGRVELLVPNRDEQAEIVSVLADADAEIAALKRRLEAARAVKTGMMQELLTGRTRLPVEAAA